MYPHHDWEPGVAAEPSGRGDVQVETLELVLFKYLSWQIMRGTMEQILLDGFMVYLRAYGPFEIED